MMSWKNLLFLVALLVVAVPLIGAQDSPTQETIALVTLPHTETFLFSSSNTGLEYQIFVALPEDYTTDNADTRYSVIYLLDANFFFGAINDFIRIENLVQELPQVIVVGIGYPQNPLGGRVMDMLENPARFLDFIGDELIPLVDERYRTNATADERTFMGHSLGGQFVLYTMFKRPELFAGYIAASPGSPTWATMTRIETAFADENSSLPVRLFMSASEQEPVQIEPFFTTIQERQYAGLEMTFFDVTNATHGSSAIPALTYGLRYIYES